MNSYILKTKARMKEYNAHKWWIGCDIIPEQRIDAKNVNSAIKQYAQIVTEKYYCSVSKNALRRKQPMYTDYANGGPAQIGYVLTAKTGFEDRSANVPYTEQYIDLWVEILQVERPAEFGAALPY